MTIKGSQEKLKSIMRFFLLPEKLVTETPKVKTFVVLWRLLGPSAQGRVPFSIS